MGRTASRWSCFGAPPVPTITVSKTLACQPAGGPIAGQIGVTVAGGNVVVSAYQDWIEYQLPGQTTWTRAGGTTVQLVDRRCRCL